MNLINKMTAYFLNSARTDPVSDFDLSRVTNNFPKIMARLKHIFTFPSESVCAGLSGPSHCQRSVRRFIFRARLLL